MDLNDAQARLVVSLGWVSQERVQQALPHCRLRPDIDLSGLLQQHGFLSPEQVTQIRTQASLQGISPSPSADHASTIVHATRRDAPEPVIPPGPASFGSLASQAEDRKDLIRAPAGLGKRLQTSAPAGRSGGQIDAALLREILGRADGSLTGYRFGKLDVVDEISRGGMGVVLRARHRDLEADVALKLMLGNHADPVGLTRFQDEARTLAQLRHPNIVRVSDYGQEGGVVYFTMDLVPGRDLDAIVGGSLAEDDSLPNVRWLAGMLGHIAEALAYCHENGVLHRDLKPANILVEEEAERPILVDFGLVKKQSSPRQEGLSEEEGGIGTPAYMSPEQIGVAGVAVEAASDVWGLGATLFFCLTGRPPFEGATIYNLYKQILTKDPPAPSSLNPEVPPWLDVLVLGCMERNPSERPTMAEVAEELLAHEKRVSKKMVALLGGAIVTLLAIVGLLVSALLAEEPLKITTLKVERDWTRDAEVLVSGRVTRPGIMVKVAGAKVRARKDGTFDRMVDLEEGENSITVRVEEEGSKAQEGRVVCHLDREAPVFEFTTAIPGIGVVLGDDGLLSGQAKDARISRLNLDGRRQEFAEDGRFALPIEVQDGGRWVELMARDAAGNETSIKLRVVSASEAKESAVIEAILSDRKRWNGASDAYQDRAVKLVLARLGKAYEFVETRRYSCGGTSHRIASFRHRRTGMLLNLIPGGGFLMGYRSFQVEAKYVRDRMGFDPRMDRQKYLAMIVKIQAYARWSLPQHKRRIRKAFLMGRFEVSQKEWDIVGGEDKRGAYPHERLPIVGTSWDNSKKWLAKAGDGFRFPSEAEWEYACRAGTKTRYPWGETIDPRYVWYFQTAVWKQRQKGPRFCDAHARYPNAFGLSDTIGNVTEWCADRWSFSYKDAPEDERVVESSSEDDSGRVWRGGAYSHNFIYLRAGGRDRADPTQFFSHQGLRVAVSIPEDVAREN